LCTHQVVRTRVLVAEIGSTEKLTMWSLMKWCQEFGWVQNDRPPNAGSVEAAQQLLRGHFGVQRLRLA
jgi:hypothetical protein